MKSKRENIAEYILYLWQLEDYLRAFPEKAQENTELMELLDMMHQEGIIAGGHLQLAKNALSELEDLHEELLGLPDAAVSGDDAAPEAATDQRRDQCRRQGRYPTASIP